MGSLENIWKTKSVEGERSPQSSMEELYELENPKERGDYDTTRA